MLQSVPQIGLAKPRLLVHFNCPTFVIVQVVGPNTLYLAETDNQLMATSDAGEINALQINQASGLVMLWWNGDMWAAGSIAFRPQIVIPGINTGSILGLGAAGLETQAQGPQTIPGYGVSS